MVLSHVVAGVCREAYEKFGRVRGFPHVAVLPGKVGVVCTIPISNPYVSLDTLVVYMLKEHPREPQIMFSFRTFPSWTVSSAPLKFSCVLWHGRSSSFPRKTEYVHGLNWSWMVFLYCTRVALGKDACAPRTAIFLFFFILCLVSSTQERLFRIFDGVCPPTV